MASSIKHFYIHKNFSLSSSSLPKHMISNRVGEYRSWRSFTVLCVTFLAVSCYVTAENNSSDSYSVWSKNYTPIILKPYEWSYLRVELPPRFSALTIALNTNIELDSKFINKRGAYRLPTMCFRQGGPPLPDFSKATLKDLVLDDVYDQSSKKLRALSIDKCYVMQDIMWLTLSNEQIAEGVLFIGLFNGIGPARTQSKMINRGRSYTFSAFLSVEACNRAIFWGQFCDKKLHRLQCVPVNNHDDNTQSNQVIGGSGLACRNHLHSCHTPDMSPKLFFLNVENMSVELRFSAYDIRLGSQSISINDTGHVAMSLIVYARNGAVPTSNLFDYITDISRNELVIETPKLGTWYFYIVPDVTHTANVSNKSLHKTPVKQLCYSLRWKILKYPLQENPIIDVDGTKLSSISFPQRISLQEDNKDYPWTYFFVEVPSNASSRNIIIDIVSNTSIEYELYARFGGLPSLKVYDYYYANQSSNSNNGLSLFKAYLSSNQRVKFDIVNAQEGKWSFGLIRRPNFMKNLESQTELFISLESCADSCSGYGTCKDVDALRSCSFCKCDTFHGGFDCSIEIVPRSEQKLQILFLVVSNAAALLPAICALWMKSYAEWVVFLSSGVASAIYHACDLQWTCVLEYGTLQFMDFWLSFVAVISTFIYMVSASEAMKRGILSVVWILTALMALSDATSSRNIMFVIIIGLACLLIALLVESSAKLIAFSTQSQRPTISSSWLLENMKKLLRSFRWRFLIAGFAALALAAISWNLEDIENYWIFHSTWHVAMYTAAFFFLCSKVNLQSEGSKPDEYNDMAVAPTTSTDSNIP
ncbi:uncharacterized protein LOC110692735 [Chenopodium quinoa]|uniref:uncharacterized protein LOC110692735 n=1 Tax=Chenopodium quinoa TaxID=63459 RepID=UPI000B7829B6|nr:uncharacterized protein LOC110692735 [Chenopodium quinoa]